MLARSGFATVARQPYAACLRGPVTSNVRRRRQESANMEKPTRRCLVASWAMSAKNANFRAQWRQVALACAHRCVCEHLRGLKQPAAPVVVGGLLRQRSSQFPAIVQAWPNLSLKRSASGRPPGPGRRYAVHFRQPGPGVLPLSPA